MAGLPPSVSISLVSGPISILSSNTPIATSPVFFSSSFLDGTLIVIFNDIIAIGADVQPDIRSGNVILVDDAPSLCVRRFHVPSFSVKLLASPSSIFTDDNGTVTTARIGWSDSEEGV